MANKASKQAKEYVTPSEFARMFSLGRSTVYDMIEDGRIAAIELPKIDPESPKTLRRIPWSEVEKTRKQRATVNT